MDIFFIEREGNKGGGGGDYKSPSEKVTIICPFFLAFVFVFFLFKSLVWASEFRLTF